MKCRVVQKYKQEHGVCMLGNDFARGNSLNMKDESAYIWKSNYRMHTYVGTRKANLL